MSFPFYYLQEMLGGLKMKDNVSIILYKEPCIRDKASLCVILLLLIAIFSLFLLGIFLVYISNAIPKVPNSHSPNPIPTHSPFLALAFPCKGHVKFASPKGLSFQWWLTRPSVARDKSSGVLVSSYCCSTYRVAVPFSSLGTFSSSSIGARVTHTIANCKHPLLCLLGPGIVSQGTAISGSFQ